MFCHPEQRPPATLAHHSHPVAAVLLCALFAASGCDNHQGAADYHPAYGTQPAGGNSKRVYSLGIVPLHNSVRLSEVFQPLVELINREAEGFSVRLESSRDFGRHEEKMRSGILDLAIVNPYQAVTAEKLGYRIFGKLRDDNAFRGIIVVRRDANIRTVGDLRGKTVCFPAPTALAATLMTKEFLIHRGLNVETAARPVYVGSHDSVLMNVYRGLAAAGGTWPATWDALRRERPEIIEALEIRWRTPSLPNMAVIARRDLPAADLAAIAAALWRLGDDEEGREILGRIGLAGLEPADSGTYAPVRRFLHDYAVHFGTVPAMEGAGK
jgi:phosphonate transport system substrate-binding protein